MTNKVDKAFETIKGYCNKQMTCKNCRFNTEEECYFRRGVIPCDWNRETEHEAVDADKLDAVVKQYEDWRCPATSEALTAVQNIQNMISEATTVDAVHVVLCKDCKHLMFSDCYGECGIGRMGIVRPEDFCSYGERRENAHEVSK